MTSVDHNHIYSNRSYSIMEDHESESSHVYFARCTETEMEVVIKVLKPLKDSRYNYRTVDTRQKCQMEALRYNKLYTQKIYIGLTHILAKDEKTIELGDYVEEVSPVDTRTASEHDYALLMHRLPDERRLDILLQSEINSNHYHYVQLVIRRVIDMHKQLQGQITLSDDPLDGEYENKWIWGSFTQIEVKLNHNLELSNKACVEKRIITSEAYLPIATELLNTLRHKLPIRYFDQRIEQRKIMRCHGDLKSQNIWLGLEPEYEVSLLDAIDFNPMYCNIDVLSDIALLITDVHARTRSLSFANDMMNFYLYETEQEDDVAKVLLTYYLVEKAVFSTAILYLDGTSDLQLPTSFWEVAEIRMKELKSQVDSL
jgi:aminoglycoside phosphotransferase family enzyme